MKINVLTTFTEMFKAVTENSVTGRAVAAGLADIELLDIRDFTTDKHNSTDDMPFGGGCGMVMTTQPVFDCLRSIEGVREHPIIYMSPRGKIMDEELIRSLAESGGFTVLCGHYEGVDQRVIDSIVDEEISIGDYVVTGGEIPACIVIDAVSRLKEGVLAAKECYEGESVASGILEYPQYTKPRVYNGMEVPEVLLSGDHKKIDRWRLEMAVEITRERRPDMLAQHPEYEEMLKPKVKKRKTRSKVSEQ